MELASVFRERLSISVQFLVADIVSGGIVLLLLTTETNSLSIGGAGAVRVGVFVFSALTLVVVLRASERPLSERVLGSVASYFVFSVITAGVFLFLYLTSAAGRI